MPTLVCLKAAATSLWARHEAISSRKCFVSSTKVGLGVEWKGTAYHFFGHLDFGLFLFLC